MKRNFTIFMSTVVGTALALSAGCSKKDGGQGTAEATASASPSSSAPTADSAKPVGSGTAPAAPPKAKEPWIPDLWEQMYVAIEGTEPTSGFTPKAIQNAWPECAHFSAREMLREKFRDAVAKATVDTNQENQDLRAKLEAEALPKRQAWIAANSELRSDFKAGVFPVATHTVGLDKYGPANATGKVVIGPEPRAGAAAFRKAFAAEPRAAKPFKCVVAKVGRATRALDSKTSEALKARGGTVPVASSVDQLSCLVVPDGENAIASDVVAVVIEVPANEARAKLKVSGETATIEGYEVTDAPGVDPALKSALESDPASLIDKIIEVGGYRKLYRGPSGPLGYALLKDRGMEMKQAIWTAEYKRVWIASFERACGDIGSTCEEPETTPSIKIVGTKAPTVASAPPASAPSTPTEPGRWEAAALDAEPSLPDPNSPHDTPWGQGFFATLIDKAQGLSDYPAPGGDAKLKAWSGVTNPLLDTFREALKKRGGFAPFECTIEDMGEELNPDPYPAVDAARKAGGSTTKEAPRWVLVCHGDAKSHIGTVVVTVPTDLAWAEIDGGKVKGYHLEHHGAFAPDLRDKLYDVGIGTRFLISGAGRLSRSMLKNVVFRESRSFPVWRLDLTNYQCPDDGAGCAVQDGNKAPFVKLAENGLKPCAVTNAVYPRP